MAVIVAISSDHFLFTFFFFFFELQGMMGMAAYQQLMILPLMVAYLLWGQELDSVYTIIKRVRENYKLYFGGGGD